MSKPHVKLLAEEDALLQFISKICQGDRVCVHCGCSDMHACLEGCWWVETHQCTPTGVCSRCVGSEGSEKTKTPRLRAGRKP